MDTKYSISQHAKERYAERVMERNSRTSIQQFINDHPTKILEDLNKMVEYGKLVYSGKNLVDPKSNDIVDVYSNGLWIICVAKRSRTIITLFKINLGAGEQLDQAFVTGLKDVIAQKQNELDTMKSENELRIIETQDMIDEKNAQISDYKNRIKMLEEQISAHQSDIVAMNHDVELAELAVRDAVMPLIGKRAF